MRIRYTFLVLFLALTHTGFGQDKTATKILEQVSSYYSKAKSIQLVMDMEVNYPGEEVNTSRVIINQSGNMFSMIHPEQEIYCDGVDVWLYIKKHNEVQINDYEEESSDDMVITPLDLVKQYESGDYDYHTIDNKDGLVVIEFKPIDRDSDYSKFKATIKKSDNSIPEMWAYGKDGSKVHISTVEMTRDLKSTMPSATFIFPKDKFPGVRVEDLRLD